jgi:phosphoglycerol transferase MdoB-like AlkP superfamily enzyme
MNSISLNDQGKIETYVIATIIFTITFLINFSKELFVEQSGKFEIFGNNLGFILVIGLLWKWKYIREIVSVLTLFVIFVIMSSVLMIKSLSIPIFVLLVAMSISFYLTTFSANVKEYLDEAQNS